MAVEQLSGAQRQTLQALDHLTRELGFPPSVRELGRFLGKRSSSTVQDSLKKLERKGYVKRIGSTPRALKMLPNNNPYTAVCPTCGGKVIA